MALRDCGDGHYRELQVATECVHEQSSFLPTMERKPPRENKRSKLGARERERERNFGRSGGGGSGRGGVQRRAVEPRGQRRTVQQRADQRREGPRQGGWSTVLAILKKLVFL